MAGSVNKVILVGNLGADPDVRSTKDGRPVVNLSVATSESWRDKNSANAAKKPNGIALSCFRRTLSHRRAIFEKRLESLRRRPIANPQMAGRQRQ